MNIKLRLAFQFTLIVAGILLFFSVMVYYLSFNSQLSKFRQNLLDNAKNTANLMINVAEVDSSILLKIHESTISRNREEVIITDSAFNIIYSYNSDVLNDRGTLIYYRGNDIKFFSAGGKDGVSYRHTNQNRSYFVYEMAFDKSRSLNLRELRKFIIASIISSICLSIIMSYFFAQRAIKPISNIIHSVKEINSLKLSNRLDEGNKNDEISQLALTFNEMLSDLEIAFRNQEEFVSNASHELRTPLTVMISESDYFLTHNRTAEEYAQHISGLVTDLKNLNSLINSLLELAQLNRDDEAPFTELRIDEVVFTVIHRVKEKYSDRKILPKIQYPENGNELIIYGNQGMLEIAFNNLIDNACKFSDKDVIVEFIIDDKYVEIQISDSGIGIPDDEIKSISKPFKRASNVKFIGGYGVGLSLVSRIMELHHAELKIQSRVNEGSRFGIRFRRISV